MVSKDDQAFRVKLGSKLRAAREGAGLTQAQVAAKAGLNANYYSIVERGEDSLSVERLHRVMKVLGIKSDLL
jgi:transcriptional regulator with XRE-family HTH domain